MGDGPALRRRSDAQQHLPGGCSASTRPPTTRIVLAHARSHRSPACGASLPPPPAVRWRATTMASPLASAPSRALADLLQRSHAAALRPALTVAGTAAGSNSPSPAGAAASVCRQQQPLRRRRSAALQRARSSAVPAPASAADVAEAAEVKAVLFDMVRSEEASHRLHCRHRLACPPRLPRRHHARCSAHAHAVPPARLPAGRRADGQRVRVTPGGHGDDEGAVRPDGE